jgi:ribosome-interacting GTPase 1
MLRCWLCQRAARFARSHFTFRYMQLVRVYTKKRGNPPDFKEPCVLTMGRNGCTVESVCRHLHRDLVREFKYALVWGRSTKHSPQTCGLEHQLTDEDVIQVLKKSGKGSGFGKAQQATSGRIQKS